MFIWFWVVFLVKLIFFFYGRFGVVWGLCNIVEGSSIVRFLIGERGSYSGERFDFFGVKNMLGWF